MEWIPGGTFSMGSDHHYPEEGPAHRVTVDGFWIDRAPVTNVMFGRFVEATGHVTLAERAPSAADYPGARPELLVPASIVFVSPSGPVDVGNHYNWWRLVPGADWRHPLGPASSLGGLDDHPVVQIAYEDAAAYARWAGKKLPTEAEFEYAARGGLDGAEFAWGDELSPGGQMMANTWQGRFPYENLAADGYPGTSPVGAFPPNGYGLLDMIGNVWEWTTDWYGARHQAKGHGCCDLVNPRGGVRADSVDPREPLKIPRKVMKGGSFLCAPNYCRRYRPAARMAQAIDTATCHLGFRCVVRAP
jgi:formylglycine-generating enzyme required for sulfatase activity